MDSDVYNTTVNYGGKTVYSSSYTPLYCGCGCGMYSVNSCFGFGFGGLGGTLGMGLGYTLGTALTPMMPSIFRGVAKGIKNLWNTIFHKKTKAENS